MNILCTIQQNIYIYSKYINCLFLKKYKQKKDTIAFHIYTYNVSKKIFMMNINWTNNLNKQMFQNKF